LTRTDASCTVACMARCGFSQSNEHSTCRWRARK
jgi:hypothetical protein